MSQTSSSTPPADETVSPDAAGWRSLYPFRSHYLQLGEHRYHYLDEGSGPVLLMVHGNPTWSFYWRHLVSAFRGTHRVVVPDHLGCGLSDKPQDYNYRLAAHIDNLTQLVEELDLQNITLLVHDWGGPIGLGAAVARPERFSRFVLFNTGAFRDVRCPWRIRICRTPGLGAIGVRGLGGFSRAALLMATNQPDRFTREVSAGYLAPYDSWQHRIAVHRFVQDIPLDVSHPSYCKVSEIETGLAQFRQHPVQLIWGMQDWCFTPHFLKRFQQEFFPQAEVHRLEEAGHYVVEDAHETIVPLVRRFLKETSEERPASLEPRRRVEIAPADIQPDAADNVCNVARRLAKVAEQMPDELAVVFPTGRDDCGRRTYDRLTFGELDRESDRMARGLREWGVQPGTRLALMVRPSLEFITLTFALYKAGVVVILIDPGMGLRHLLNCLAEAEPEGFVAIPPVHAVRSLLRGRFPAAKYNVTVGGHRWFWGGITLDELRAEDWSGPELAPTKADDPAAIIFTSGSTGPPKGVLYRHGNFDAQVRELQTFFDIQPGEINLPGFPLFALFDAAMGVTTVIPDMNPTRPADVDPPKIIEAVHDWQVTQAFGSPAMWNRVGRYCEEHNLRLPTLRRVLSAGAPVPPATLARMKAAIAPDGDVHTPYGATESLPVASLPASVILSETAPETRNGAGTCVGPKFPGIDWKVIEIVDAPLEKLADVKELPPGEIGELIVRGDVVTTEYFRRPEATARAKIVDEGLWHRMGDVGYLDEQGRFWFCGRMAHRVLTTEGPLYTVPCEAIFNEHPAIDRSALVGVGPEGKQTPVIVLEPLPKSFPQTSEASRRLLAEMRELAAAHETTKRIEHFLLHRCFPVDIRHNSKIFREQLADWAKQYFPRLA